MSGPLGNFPRDELGRSWKLTSLDKVGRGWTLTSEETPGRSWNLTSEDTPGRSWELASGDTPGRSWNLGSTDKPRRAFSDSVLASADVISAGEIIGSIGGKTGESLTIGIKNHGPASSLEVIHDLKIGGLWVESFSDMISGEETVMPSGIGQDYRARRGPGGTSTEVTVTTRSLV